MQNAFATLLAGLALGICVSASASPTREAEEGYLRTDDGTRIFYQKIGRGDQVVIVPVRLFAFEAFKTLADQFTVISYDPRGRGRSDPIADADKPAKIGIHQDVADLERIRKHFNAPKVNLIGYSYTGLMVVMYAMEFPDRVERIVQLGPVPMKFGTEYPKNLTATDQPADPKQLEELRRLQKENYPATHPRDTAKRSGVICASAWSAIQRGSGR